MKSWVCVCVCCMSLKRELGIFCNYLSFIVFLSFLEYFKVSQQLLESLQDLTESVSNGRAPALIEAVEETPLARSRRAQSSLHSVSVQLLTV